MNVNYNRFFFPGSADKEEKGQSESDAEKNLKLTEDLTNDEADDLEIVSGTEADVTAEDLELLGPKDGDMDMGDDELFRGKTGTSEDINADLDIPGSELDDQNEEIGEEDEENNYYSLGGDRHEDLEEDNQQG